MKFKICIYNERKYNMGSEIIDRVIYENVDSCELKKIKVSEMLRKGWEVFDEDNLYFELKRGEETYYFRKSFVDVYRIATFEEMTTD